MSLELFKPIDGRCPYCGGEHIHILESSISGFRLGKDGCPEQLESETYSLCGYCDTCKRSVYVEPDERGRFRVFQYENYVQYSNFIDRVLGNEKIVHKATVHPDPKPEENAFMKKENSELADSINDTIQNVCDTTKEVVSTVVPTVEGLVDSIKKIADIIVGDDDNDPPF